MSLPSVEFPDSKTIPIRRAARRMRWFIDAFSKQVDALSAQTGVVFEIHGDRLRSLFLDWVKNFEAQKPTDQTQRKNYITFAAGLMLQELINGKPLTVVEKPVDCDENNPAYFWPEGYAYVAFCLNVRSAVFEQDLDLESDAAPPFEEIRTWWSFKENVAEESSSAIGFLELFVGGDPNWSSPAFFSAKHAEQNALRFYTHGSKRISN